jgi:hypothetical protein
LLEDFVARVVNENATRTLTLSAHAAVSAS